MTNKSMISPEEAKSREAQAGTGKSKNPLADETHPHAPQLKPVLDEDRPMGKHAVDEDSNKSKGL
jgi:hypothetical protein